MSTLFSNLSDFVVESKEDGIIYALVSKEELPDGLPPLMKIQEHIHFLL